MAGSAFSANDEIEVIRQRLIEDALVEKGFLTRTGRYIQSDFGKAGACLNSLQPNGSWPDVNYADRDNNWNPLVVLDRILMMTYAHQNTSDPLYQDTRLLSGIVKALQYWYQVNPACKNWYKNDIAKQFYFNVIALLEINITIGNKEGKRKTEMITLPKSQFAGSSVRLDWH